MAQNINFYDKNFEEGVKEQLGLDSSDMVSREMADTLSVLNLEGLGIKDLRDIVYFPSLEELNLGYNAIRDISPLLELGRLRYLNIRNNLLDAVDLLALTESPQMTVNLSLNYITNFYALLHSPQCLFSIIGIKLQHPNNYEVRNFYVDYNLSNMSGIVNSNFWLLHSLDTCFVENGKQSFTVLPDTIQQTSMNVSTNKVYLTLNNAAIDSTCFIPPTTIETIFDSIAFTPGFSEDYEILSAEAFHSEASFSNDSVFFKFSGEIEQDTLKVGFGTPFGKLKGYTYYYVEKKNITGIGNIQHNGIELYPNPATDICRLLVPDELCNENTVYVIVNPAGKVFHKETIKNEETTIIVSHLPASVYFIVVFDDKQIIANRKLIKN